MKKFLIAILIPVLSCTSGFAKTVLITDFAGLWEGTRTEYVNGTRYTAQQIVLIRNKDGGLNIKTTIRFSFATLTATGKYEGNGKYSANLFSNGQVVGISSGSWKLNGDTIKAKATTRTIAGVQSGTANLRLANRNTLISIGNTSQGSVTITLHRR
ncbi:MAG: hypothetical protein PHC88_11155 [Terrimicrobiaceae bacterium]|nr:hypothetical protein [Terrimicrobiaceae bacterium]